MWIWRESYMYLRLVYVDENLFDVCTLENNE